MEQASSLLMASTVPRLNHTKELKGAVTNGNTNDTRLSPTPFY